MTVEARVNERTAGSHAKDAQHPENSLLTFLTAYTLVRAPVAPSPKVKAAVGGQGTDDALDRIVTGRNDRFERRPGEAVRNKTLLPIAFALASLCAQVGTGPGTGDGIEKPHS